MRWPSKYQIKRWMKDFLYFPKSDRRVLLTFCLILGGIAVYLLWQLTRPFPEIRPLSHQQRVRLDSFLTHIDQMERMRLDSLRQKRRTRTVSERSEPVLFPFDPNTADSLQLLQLGFQSWQIRNLKKYRSKGGRFYKAEDLTRLYGMTEEFYDRLKPYIRITNQESQRLRKESDEVALSVPEEHTQAEVLPDTGKTVRDLSVRPAKFSEGVVIDLNQADTGLLKRIPGIGSAYARMIVSYRERLGGYVRTEQLHELKSLPERITRWFSVSGAPRPLYINRLTVAQLRRHPYLNFYQARIIVEHRRKYGPLRSLDDLSLYSDFTPADLDRLRPYVQF